MTSFLAREEAVKPPGKKVGGAVAGTIRPGARTAFDEVAGRASRTGSDDIDAPIAAAYPSDRTLTGLIDFLNLRSEPTIDPRLARINLTSGRWRTADQYPACGGNGSGGRYQTR